MKTVNLFALCNFKIVQLIQVIHLEACNEQEMTLNLQNTKLLRSREPERHKRFPASGYKGLAERERRGGVARREERRGLVLPSSVKRRDSALV